MRVLDIDLDFFLEDCCPLAAPGERPSLDGHRPWTVEQTECFIREQLGLNEAHPVPGKIFETHDQALLFWQQRIGENKLSVPFSVTHIDAHSDLGIGKPGPGYVLNNVAAQSLERRRESKRHYELHQLDEANYLLFAIAYRYIDVLENVRNPRSRKDIPNEILMPGRSDIIRLHSFAADLMAVKNGPEPEIAFHVYNDYKKYKASEPYDYMTVAVSPRYAPAEADALLPVFEKYMIIEN